MMYKVGQILYDKNDLNKTVEIKSSALFAARNKKGDFKSWAQVDPENIIPGDMIETRYVLSHFNNGNYSYSMNMSQLELENRYITKAQLRKDKLDGLI